MGLRPVEGCDVGILVPVVVEGDQPAGLVPQEAGLAARLRVQQQPVALVWRKERGVSVSGGRGRGEGSWGAADGGRPPGVACVATRAEVSKKSDKKVSFYNKPFKLMLEC